MIDVVELTLIAIAVVACIAAACVAVKLVVGRQLADRERADAARLEEMIATLKRSQDDLRQLALVAETTSDLISIADKNWNLVWVNRAFERVTGYSSSDVVGRKPSDFGIDQLKAPEELMQMLTALNRGEAVADAFQLTSKSGRKFDLEGMIQPVKDETGTVCKYIGTHRDVTQRVAVTTRLRESEARYQLVMRGSADGIWDWNIKDDKVYLSMHLKSMMGYEDADDLSASMVALDTLVHPEDRTRVVTARRRHIEERLPYDVQCRLCRKDGSYRWFRVCGQAQWDRLGVATRMAGSVSNIDELIRSQNEAMEASRLKSEFLANMSHEIRTPMNGVMGMTQLLMRTSLDDKQQKFASTILSASKSLLGLINDILDLSKIESGMMKIESSWFDMAEIVQRAATNVEGVATLKKSRMHCTIAPECLGSSKGDADRIVQVLVNLLGNAIKFTGEGDVHLRIEAAANGTTKFLVVDSGPGIAAEQLALIFQRFTQVDGSSTRKHGGTGLGLAICRELVTLMGGEIGVESTLGEGATFWFALPLERQALAMEASDDAHAAEQAQTTYSGRHALIAEDIATNQAVMSEMLQQLGFSVTVVDNGLAALKRLETETFDVVFMDIQMPMMNGDAAIEKIRRSGAPYASVPIVVVTANAMKGMQEKFIGLGADAYVSKPIDFKDLRTVTAKVMHGIAPRQAA